MNALPHACRPTAGTACLHLAKSPLVTVIEAAMDPRLAPRARLRVCGSQASISTLSPDQLRFRMLPRWFPLFLVLTPLQFTPLLCSLLDSLHFKLSDFTASGLHFYCCCDSQSRCQLRDSIASREDSRPSSTPLLTALHGKMCRFDITLHFTSALLTALHFSDSLFVLRGFISFSPSDFC